MQGSEIPEWFTFPEVARELYRSHPPRLRQGGARVLHRPLALRQVHDRQRATGETARVGGRPITLLGGDLVRKHLSSEFGFSKQHRDINVRRIGMVSAELTTNGSIAVCAPLAPYDAIRKDLRAMVEPVGGFLLMHVATPIEVCEARDSKARYAEARAGIIPEFIGVSDPREPPQDADLALDTADLTAEQILQHLERGGYLQPGKPGA